MRRQRNRKVTVTAATAAVLIASTLGAASTEAKPKPKKLRPNLGVASVLGMPTEVLVDSRFGIKVLMGNDGQAAAPRSRVSLHLSRDTKRSAGDLTVGSAAIPRLGPWKTHVAPAKIDVPGSAKGAYYVIACADARHQVKERNEKNNCLASLTTVDVVRPVNGTLRGKIDLFDTGAAGPKTWNRTAHLDVALSLKGKGKSIKVTDIGSSYSWLGESHTLVVAPECSTTHAEDEDHTGPFADSADGHASMGGAVGNSQLSKIELGTQMAYAVTGQITSPCTDPMHFTDTREQLLDIYLEQVSATASTITYRVDDTLIVGLDTETSDWETAQGRLTLTLK